MNNKAKRDSRIDFYKGMLILGVIWGHTITALRAGEGSPVWILTFFRTYDMPFFMLLSGYFLELSMRGKSWIRVAVKRAGSILVPLAAWQLAIGLTGPLFESLRSLFSLWFLWSLVCCTGIVIGIRAVIRNKKAALILEVICVLLAHCFEDIPFNVGYMLFFFVLGYHLQELLEKIPDRIKSCGPLLMGAAFVIMQCFWRGEYNVWNAGTYVLSDPLRLVPIVCFRGLIGICGCMTMMKLFDVLYGAVGTVSRNFVVRAGKETMLLYIMQSVVVEKILAKAVMLLSSICGGNPLVFNMGLLGYVLAPAVSVAVIAFLMWCIRLIRRVPVVSDVFTGVRM